MQFVSIVDRAVPIAVGRPSRWSPSVGVAAFQTRPHTPSSTSYTPPGAVADPLATGVVTLTPGGRRPRTTTGSSPTAFPTDPSFFPIGVWDRTVQGPGRHRQRTRRSASNTYVNLQSDPSVIPKDSGMHLILGPAEQSAPTRPTPGSSTTRRTCAADPGTKSVKFDK